MTFAEVDQRYLALKQQFDVGDLAEDEFDEALRALMIQDELGRWWAKARDSGQWNYYDAVTQTWTPASPPAPVSPLPSRQPAEPHPAQQVTTPAQYVQPVSQQFSQFAPQQATPVAQDYVYTTGQPELSPGLKVVFYILSFLVPIVGIVLFFVYRGKPAPEDRAAANLFLILGAISFGLSCLCSFAIPLMLVSFS